MYTKVHVKGLIDATKLLLRFGSTSEPLIGKSSICQKKEESLWKEGREVTGIAIEEGRAASKSPH